MCATTASTRENFDDKYLQLNFKTRLPLLLPSGEDWNALKCFFEASSSQKASNGMEIKVSESSRNIQRLLPSQVLRQHLKVKCFFSYTQIESLVKLIEQFLPASIYKSPITDRGLPPQT